MSEEKHYRVTRVLVYEGTPRFLNNCLSKRGVKDVQIIHDGKITETFLSPISFEEVERKIEELL